MPLTQFDLGDALGLTNIHVNRTLRKMRARGLIVLRSRTRTIPNFKAIQRIALFGPDYLHLSGEDAIARTRPSTGIAGAR